MDYWIVNDRYNISNLPLSHFDRIVTPIYAYSDIRFNLSFPDDVSEFFSRYPDIEKLVTHEFSGTPLYEIKPEQVLSLAKDGHILQVKPNTSWHITNAFIVIDGKLKDNTYTFSDFYNKELFHTAFSQKVSRGLKVKDTFIPGYVPEDKRRITPDWERRAYEGKNTPTKMTNAQKYGKPLTNNLSKATELEDVYVYADPISKKPTLGEIIKTSKDFGCGVLAGANPLPIDVCGDPNSTAYKVGEAAEAVGEIVLSGGTGAPITITKMAAKKAAKKAMKELEKKAAKEARERAIKEAKRKEAEEIAAQTKSPMGSKRSPFDVKNSQTIDYKPTKIEGIDYSKHAQNQMKNRGFTPSVIKNTIDNGIMSPGHGNAIKYYDKVNNVSVIVDKTTKNVITVRYGP